MENVGLRSQKIIRVFLVIGAGLYLLSLYHRCIDISDVWGGERAYWLARLGYAKEELFRGFLGYENHIFVYHKLFDGQGGLLTRFFGFNVYVLKSLSLFYFVLLLWLFSRFLQLYDIAKELWPLAFLTMLSAPLMFNLSFVFRPDVSATFLGLASFYVLTRHERKTSLGSAVGAGALAGLATASHLNGVIFMGAGVVLCLWRREWLGTLFFAVFALLFASIYFYDVRSMMDLQTLFLQFRDDPSVTKEFAGPWHWLWKLLGEQQRYLYSPPEIAYSVFLVLFAVPYTLRMFRQDRRGQELVIYTYCLALLLALVSHGKTVKYLIYFQPLFFLMAFRAWPWATKRVARWRWGILFLILLCWWQTNFTLLLNRDQVIARNEEVGEQIQQGTQVLAPLNFILYNIEHLKIQGLHLYRFFVEKGDLQQTPEALFGEAAFFKNQYVFVDLEWRNYFHLQEKDYPPYKFIGRWKPDQGAFQNQMWIYKK